MQCFRQYWSRFSSVQVTGVSAVQGEEFTATLRAITRRSLAEFLRVLNIAYREGHAYWQDQNFERARQCMLNVRNIVHTAKSAKEIAELGNVSLTEAAMRFFVPAANMTIAGLYVEMSQRKDDESDRKICLCRATWYACEASVGVSQIWLHTWPRSARERRVKAIANLYLAAAANKSGPEPTTFQYESAFILAQGVQDLDLLTIYEQIKNSTFRLEVPKDLYVADADQ